jgi:hypothetical protein
MTWKGGGPIRLKILANTSKGLFLSSNEVGPVSSEWAANEE